MSEKNTIPDYDPAAHLDRLARYHVGVRLVLGRDLQLSGPGEIVRAAAPFIAARKAEIVDWIGGRNSPPVPTPYVRKESTAPRRPPRDFSRCCVCGRPARVTVGDWPDRHPFCLRHIPEARLPFPLPSEIRNLPAIAEAHFETTERLAIIHDGDDCACFHPSPMAIPEPPSVAPEPASLATNATAPDYPTDPEQEKAVAGVYPDMPVEV